MKQLKWKQIYDAIIERARSRSIVTGEKHHILPRCMGGTDEVENIVLLTAREHFLCHKLLLRFADQQHLLKLQHAFSYMALTKDAIRPSLRVTSRDYALARSVLLLPRSAEWRANISKALKGKPQASSTVAKMKATLTGRVLSKEHCENIAKASTGRRHTSCSRDKLRQTKSKSYTIVHPDGTKELVIGLKRWCSDHGVNYTSLRNTITRDHSHKGYKVLAN